MIVTVSVREQPAEFVNLTHTFVMPETAGFTLGVAVFAPDSMKFAGCHK
ncbi:MAG: hypothetical protein HC817_04770 [Saprospiraceae bacterium]|nr:hypothetical protein [Saprospiraceae bacterium]